MKKIKDFLFETKFDLDEITEFGTKCIESRGSIWCGNVLFNFVKGVKEGMLKNKNEDIKFQKRCEDCIDNLLETINKEIY